ncbi:unnamed protein product, partial [Nippostrongylus brasiliensis]|uniref:Secreted protein n=1 Tax=Nippostrongylus brasiliensis TaxID=27835 RepID=A0A0N4XQP4_NIPBR
MPSGSTGIQPIAVSGVLPILRAVVDGTFSGVVIVLHQFGRGFRPECTFFLHSVGLPVSVATPADVWCALLVVQSVI